MIEKFPAEPDSSVHGDIGRLMVEGSEQTGDLAADAERLFQKGSLLVRALDPPQFLRQADGTIGLDYLVIDSEMSALQGKDNHDDETGLRYASSSMLLPVRHIPTYKNFGFIFDGDQAALHHIHYEDSVSSGQGDDFRAAPSELRSLDELTVVVDQRPPAMNEVNATFQADQLKGLFAVQAPRPLAKINAWFTRQHLRATTAVDYPIMTYDISAGTVTPWEAADDEIKALITDPTLSQTSRAIYGQAYTASQRETRR